MQTIINPLHLIEYGAVGDYTFIKLSIFYGLTELCVHNFFNIIEMATHSYASGIFFLEFFMQQEYFLKKSPGRQDGGELYFYVFFIVKNLSHKTPDAFNFYRFVH